MTQNTAGPDTSLSTIERGREHVLVVEDDDMVRNYVVQQLGSLGYQVSEARDGFTGLEILRQRDDIDLLFTDIVLPGGMLGPKLAETAKLLRPELHILFTSGYSADTLNHNGEMDQGFELLQKPYRRQELAQGLRKVLAG